LAATFLAAVIDLIRNLFIKELSQVLTLENEMVFRIPKKFFVYGIILIDFNLSVKYEYLIVMG